MPPVVNTVSGGCVNSGFALLGVAVSLIFKTTWQSHLSRRFPRRYGCWGKLERHEGNSTGTRSAHLDTKFTTPSNRAAVLSGLLPPCNLTGWPSSGLATTR